MKKCLAVILAAILWMLPLCAWGENTLPQASCYDLSKKFENLPGFVQNGDDWSLVAHETLALKNYIGANGKTAGAFGGFYFSLNGDKEESAVVPCLHVFYRAAGQNLGLKAVSFLVNDVRYDFAGKTAYTSYNGVQVEEMTVPLNAQGMDFMRNVCASQQLTLQVYGQKSEDVVLQLTSAPKKTTDYMANACLNGAASLLKLLDGAYDMGAYLLWDVNERICQEKGWGEANMQVSDLAWAKNAAPFADTAMGVLSVGDMGEAVTLLQEQLSARGFLLGTATTQYTVQMQSAVAMAQKYYGLLETGVADRYLYDCLLNCEAFVTQEETAESVVAVEGEEAHWTLNRYWFAQSVQAQKAESTLGKRSANDGDEVLLVMEGEAVNESYEAVNASHLEAQLHVGNVQITCEVLYEKDGQTLLADSLSAKQQSRLLLVARVPASLMAEDMALALTCGENVTEIQLAK